MGGKGKEATQRFLAMIVIIAMMMAMGIPAPVIFFFAIVVYFVWRAVKHSEDEQTRNIFRFYGAANEILRDDERRWYGFEIADVIARGESILMAMKDPPPLVLFALGALHQRAGDDESALEHLSQLTEHDRGDEKRRFAPSPELQRYVEVLRRLEREPAQSPPTMAAVRSLERARRVRAQTMLSEVRERLETSAAAAPPSTLRAADAATPKAIQNRHIVEKMHSNSMQSFSAPPQPIAEVLRELYEEEKKTA